MNGRAGMMGKISAREISRRIQGRIAEWHERSEGRPDDYEIVTEDVRRIRPLNEHRDDIYQAVDELADTNAEMWHEEDKVRSEDDAVVLRAIRNINPLNQHRNDLIEEIDEIAADIAAGRRGS